jgi:hypothetical protein
VVGLPQEAGDLLLLRRFAELFLRDLYQLEVRVYQPRRVSDTLAVKLAEDAALNTDSKRGGEYSN